MDQERYPFTRDPVFKYVMENAEIAHDLIECALGKEIDGEVRVEIQREVSIKPGYKEVRCDALCRDAENNVYDLEMQRRKYTPLVERMRAYQAMLDVDAMRKGDVFTVLKEVFIIFICTYDPFGCGEPRYIFEMDAIGDSKAVINPGIHWVVLNSKASDMADSADLAALLNYVANGEVSDNDLVKRIDDEVAEANKDKGVREMITMEQKHQLELRETAAACRAEGRAEGIVEGRDEGTARTRKLTKILLDAERYEDLSRMTEDSAYFEQLCQELGI